MVGNDSILRMLSEIESDELHKACFLGVTTETNAAQINSVHPFSLNPGFMAVTSYVCSDV